MVEYNLESSMKVEQPVDTGPKLVEVVDSIAFVFPEKILAQTSSLNTKWQDVYSKKLIGRILAGSIKKLVRGLARFNESMKLALYADPGRGTRKEYVQKALLHNVDTFNELLRTEIENLDGRLKVAYQFNEIRFPVNTEPLVMALIKAGFFENLKPNSKLEYLPPKFKMALGMVKELPAPYDEGKKNQQAALEQAIRVLEKLYPVVSRMREHRVTSHFEEIERSE